MNITPSNNPAHLAHLPTLLFWHLDKTGGTTLIHWLQRHYPPAVALMEASDDATLGATSLSRLQQVSFIRGHFTRDGVALIDRSYELILLLRDPVERVVSFYKHQREDPEAAYYAYFQRTQPSLDDVLADPLLSRHVSNHMTARLGGSRDHDNALVPHAPPLKENSEDLCLVKAKEVINRASVVGVTDQYDLFIRTLCARYPLVYDSHLPIARRASLTMELDESTRNNIEALNTLDRSLYVYAQNRISEDEARYINTGNPAVAKGWEHQSLQHIDRQSSLQLERFADWHAYDSPVSQGWHDVTYYVDNPSAAHRWSGPDKWSFIDLALVPGNRYIITITIFRFVEAEAWPTLPLTLNGIPVTATLSPQTATSQVDFQYSAISPAIAATDPASGIRVGLCNSVLRSFASVNPKDKDTLPRGFALRSLTVRPTA